MVISGKMQKKEVLAYFKPVLEHCPEDTKDNHENLKI
jgi:hypothetical protein